MCNYLERFVFLQENIGLRHEAKEIFSTKSAFGTPRRRIIVKAAQRSPLRTSPKASKDYRDDARALEIYREDESCYKTLDALLHKIEHNPFLALGSHS